MNPLGNQGARKRSNAFYGQDSGTQFSEDARNAIEHDDEGRGGKGNNVDFSQRTADDEIELDPQAENTIKTLKEKFPHGFYNTGGSEPYQHVWGDPESEKKLREMLVANDRKPAQPQEEKEEPSLTGNAQDKFFGNIEEMKKYTSRKL